MVLEDGTKNRIIVFDSRLLDVRYDYIPFVVFYESIILSENYFMC